MNLFELSHRIRLDAKDVSLRPLCESDAPGLAAAAAGLKDRHPFSFVPLGIEAARTYVETALNERSRGERYPFSIWFCSELVGTTSYMDFAWWERVDAPTTFPAALEIGATWLASRAQRTRCNTQAKYLLLTHAFDHWKVERVSFRTDERNAVSRAAIERLGARFEGIRRVERLGADGALRNSAFYSIIKCEWPLIRRRLENRLA